MTNGDTCLSLKPSKLVLATLPSAALKGGPEWAKGGASCLFGAKRDQASFVAPLGGSVSRGKLRRQWGVVRGR